MVDVARPLAPFVRRPPTPPKESTFKTIEDGGLPAEVTSKPLLDAPEESPSSSTDNFKNILRRVRKKVVISGEKQYHQPPDSSSKGYDSDDLRHLPPSRECKSTRSILKQSFAIAQLDGGDDSGAFDGSSLPVMLRSAAQHLASESRSSRHDAYSSLSAFLSTYENIPEAEDLTEKVGELTGFIKRDVVQKASGNLAVDIQLTTQAIKLLITFFSMPNLAVNVPENFRHFIIDQAITNLTDEKSPKILVSHYMHLLEKQKFGSKIMNAERVNKILTALEDITTRVKGTRIVSHRLMIYWRLLGQTRSTMAAKAGSWFSNLIAGLLSSLKDLRTRAIHFGMEAGIQLGSSKNVSQACLSIMNSQSKEGKKLVDLLCARMALMVKSHDDGQHVPQMWSVVIFFLRSRPRQLECWEHMKPWISIMQDCFNSKDPQIKFEAHLAWRRLIFAVNVGAATSPSMAKMLKNPIAPSLTRRPDDKSSDRDSETTKQHARGTYCTLLYYALRPNTTYEKLDAYWDMYVAEIIPMQFATGNADIDQACILLAALLSSEGQSRIWYENRGNMSSPVKVSELPSIDPKWIRSRAGKIMTIFDRLFTIADWTSNGDDLPPVLVAWRNFMSALGTASSKEVKTSTDTMNAIAHIISQMKTLLDKQKIGDHPSKTMFDLTASLVEVAVGKLGSLAFNEKRLVLTAQQSFEASSETPSSRLRMNSASLNSATVHLLRLVLGKQIDRRNFAHVSLVKRCLQIATQSTTTRHGVLSLLRNLARLCISDDDALPSQSRLVLWREIGESATSALGRERTLKAYGGSPVFPGHEYRDTVKILEIGLSNLSKETSSTWDELYRKIIEKVEQEVSASAITPMVTEALVEAIFKEDKRQLDDFLCDAAVKTISNIHWPANRQSLERTQVQLWGAASAVQKSSVSDLSDETYFFVGGYLEKCYTAVSQLSNEVSVSLIAAITSFIHACPPCLKLSLLHKLQPGLAPWIEDAQETLVGPRKQVFLQVKKMWAVVVTSIQSVSDSSKQILSSIQILMTASLRSRHKLILNDAVNVWNRAFSCADDVEYSDALRKTLVKLRSSIEIDVPGLLDDIAQESDESPIRLIESQSDGNEFDVPVMELPGAFEMQAPCLTTPSQGKRSSHAHLSSPLPSARRSARVTPKARLRHDDSQIQFAAIESSPLAANDDYSAMLTERQKEVKERQAADTAMFPEIRSSPAATGRATDQPLPRLKLWSKGAPQAGLDEHDNISPTFPDDNEANEFLGSSPTPSSSRHRSQERHNEDDPVSSPPFISSHLQLSDPVAPKTSNNCSVSKEIVHAPVAAASDALPGLSGPPQRADEHVQGDSKTMNIFSDQDVFVDAHSEPHISSDDPLLEVQLSSDVAKGSDRGNHSSYTDANPERDDRQESSSDPYPEASRITASFQSEVSSRYSIEDEAAAAQLLAEMEAQQSRRNSLNTTRPTSKKRKSTTSESPSKRARTSKASQQSLRSTTATSVGEVTADCVLIDARPVRGMFQSVSPELAIKQERSVSPPAATILSMVAETPAPARQRSGRGRSCGRSRSSSQLQQSGGRSGRKPSVKKEPDGDDEHHSSRVPKRTRRSTRNSDLSRASPPSSNPSHADEGDPKTSLTWMGAEDQRPDARLSSQSSRVVPQTIGVVSGEAGPSAQKILQEFRKTYDDLKHVALRPEEERAMVSVLFESIQRIHDAGRRYTGV